MTEQGARGAVPFSGAEPESGVAEAILFVDDEENMRKSAARVFADYHIPLLVAADAAEALELLKREEVAVVITDQRMPGMSGVELLETIARRYPDTVKMLVTGYADLATAMAAINLGEAFRFIVKPWHNNELLSAVEHGVQRYRLIKAMKREDEDVLRSLGQTIELKDPCTKGHCDRVAEYAVAMAEALNLPAQGVRDIKFGSWLHDCGKIGVPETILNFRGPVSTTDFDVIRKHPEWGADVARKARMSDSVVNIILYHHERYDGEGYPLGLAGSEIPLEARVVAIADIFDALTTDRPYRKAFSRDKAIHLICDMKGNALDPELVDLLLGRVLVREPVFHERNGDV